ncbi:uncharacterized protein VICG_00924 [Vittaforma corneae ATCC 50505]|uniref:Uncharacterized protein n=1 Tax=Vittaforma corneae (strain ATCC 50505) TaxID=993615 RepID=L2GNK8_VITCO|nr:uncharacterized protein VICG_00924 [Vittaforma corneae ATCC 50505]ELA42075.1 hypothetical protein VICG_00924 [Vittaforma corneae ATCC 50505]
MINSIKSSEIEPNENINSCVVLGETSPVKPSSFDNSIKHSQHSNIEHGSNEILIKSSNDGTTSHLKDTLIQNITKSAQRGVEIVGGKIVFDKYPGFIYIAIDSLEKLNVGLDSMVSLQMDSGSISISTQRYYSNSFIKVSQYIKIPVLNQLYNKIKMKILVIEHSKSGRREIFQGSIDFSSKNLEDIHNTLVENRLELDKKASPVDAIRRLIGRKRDDRPICKYYCSFISSSEIDLAKNAPDSLISLSKWIVFRKYAFEQLFQGFLNVKNPEDNFTWNKRYVRWFGYAIYLFDVHTGNLVHVVDLSDSEPSLEMIQRNIILFRINGRPFEIECDSIESLKECTEATYRLFPKVIDWI